MLKALMELYSTKNRIENRKEHVFLIIKCVKQFDI